GATKVEDNERVTAPVAADAVIWLVVPARLVTPVLAMVMVSVAPPVVEIPVPAAMVRVSPLEMVWFDPDVPAAVKEAPETQEDIDTVPEPLLWKQPEESADGRVQVTLVPT